MTLVGTRQSATLTSMALRGITFRIGRYRGYWYPADIIKERVALEAAYGPWMLWEHRAERTPLQDLIARTAAASSTLSGTGTGRTCRWAR